MFNNRQLDNIRGLRVGGEIVYHISQQLDADGISQVKVQLGTLPLVLDVQFIGNEKVGYFVKIIRIR